MSLAFQCERCGKDFNVANELAGRRGKCKQCGHVFVIPSGQPTRESSSVSSPRPASQRTSPRATTPPPAQATRRSLASEVDPYGFDDEPTASLPLRQVPDHDEPLPQRPKPAKNKKRKSRSTGSQASSSTDFPYWVFVFGALFGFVMARKLSLLSPVTPNQFWIALAFVAYTSSCSGSLACLVIAFREGWSHLICSLFIPFYVFYYIISRWEYTKHAFAVVALGWISLAVLNSMAPSLGRPLEHDPRIRMGAAPRRPHAPPAPETSSPPRKVLADFTDQALADLKSPTLHDRNSALNRLEGAAPNDRRAEIAKAVEPLLKDPDGFCRARAAKVLGIWGGPENIPALVDGLKDTAFGVRWAVLDSLEARRDPTSADALIDYLMNSGDRSGAAKALKAIGPAAEEAVIRGLGHHDDFTRLEVCEILKEIGTSKSIVPLQRVARRNQGLDSMAARDALRQISLRQPR